MEERNADVCSTMQGSVSLPYWLVIMSPLKNTPHPPPGAKVVTHAGFLPMCMHCIYLPVQDNTCFTQCTAATDSNVGTGVNALHGGRGGVSTMYNNDSMICPFFYTEL